MVIEDIQVLFKEQENEIARLSKALGDAEAERNLAQSYLRMIRSHWSAFLLPRALR